MDALCDMRNTGVRVLESIFPGFVKSRAERESWNMRSFVMKEQDAQDCRVCEKNVQVEIQDGFNSNLVIQHYRERKKVIIYIPRGWQKKITVDVTDGTILCRQSEPDQGLRLSVTRGEILCGEAG